MKPKSAWHLVCFAVIVTMLLSPVVLADDDVGVKEGQWIEYRVITSGEVPEGHNVTWSKIEVVDVEGKNISVEITSKYSDEVVYSKNSTLNLETGEIGDGFIIPANLDIGEAVNSTEGNITVNDVKDKTYAGANRKVVYGNNTETQFSWDKTTGVLLEANSSCSNFTVITKVERTNMWQAQVFGIDPFVFSVPIIAVVIAVMAFFMIRKMKD